MKLESCNVTVKGFRVPSYNHWVPSDVAFGKTTCCPLMKKDKIPQWISIMDGWMEFDFGAMGLCKRLCFVGRWIFSCLVRQRIDWMVYFGILHLLETIHLALCLFSSHRWTRWTWSRLFATIFDKQFFLKPVAQKKTWWCLPCNFWTPLAVFVPFRPIFCYQFQKEDIRVPPSQKGQKGHHSLVAKNGDLWWFFRWTPSLQVNIPPKKRNGKGPLKANPPGWCHVRGFFSHLKMVFVFFVSVQNGSAWKTGILLFISINLGPLKPATPICLKKKRYFPTSSRWGCWMLASPGPTPPQVIWRLRVSLLFFCPFLGGKGPTSRNPLLPHASDVTFFFWFQKPSKKNRWGRKCVAKISKNPTSFFQHRKSFFFEIFVGNLGESLHHQVGAPLLRLGLMERKPFLGPYMSSTVVSGVGGFFFSDRTIFNVGSGWCFDWRMGQVFFKKTGLFWRNEKDVGFSFAEKRVARAFHQKSTSL